MQWLEEEQWKMQMRRLCRMSFTAYTCLLQNCATAIEVVTSNRERVSVNVEPAFNKPLRNDDDDDDDDTDSEAKITTIRFTYNIK